MLSLSKEERKPRDLSKGHMIFLLCLVSMGSSIIYAPAYLKYTFYNQLLEALHVDNTQLGAATAAYALAATICYLPSGILADKIRVRVLGWVGFVGTAILTYVYAFIPSIAESSGPAAAYRLLVFVHVGMGITTILIWWGIRFKLIRLISVGEEDYSRKIGLSYGVYGAAGLIIGLCNAAILGALSSVGLGIKVLLMFLATIILVLGVLTFLFTPRFAGEIGEDAQGFSLRVVLDAVRLPAVWLAAVTMFCVYFFYSNMYWITPYYTGVIGAGQNATNLISVLRTYGVTLLSAPVFGFIAAKMKSPSKVIIIGSVLSTATWVSLNIIPSNPGVVILVGVLQLFLAFVSNGVFGICSSQLSEGKVPLSVFGTATGLLSVVGFLPDTICPIWFGRIVDRATAAYKTSNNVADLAAGYHELFWILGAGAALACVSAGILLFYVKRYKEGVVLDS